VGQGPQGRESLVADEGAPVPVTVQVVGDEEGAAGGPLHQAPVHSQPTKQIRPRGWASVGPHRGGIYSWEWISVGTLDLNHSHPASLSDVCSWLRRTRSTRSIPRFLSPQILSMERGRGEGRAGSKRQFDGYDSEAGRRLEKQLRSRLEYEEEHRQRERAASRDWDRNRSPEWRRSEDRRREEDRRAQGEPSRP
jgi:hypothetical protein